jgi:all-trans-retinol 13,14-reductase
MSAGSATQSHGVFAPNDPHKPYRLLSEGLPDGVWDAIIIGTGIGGMACGAALAKQGERCLLLEQHYVPGGLTHVFKRKGFEWDVGVHCVGEMGPRDIPGKLMNWLTDGSVEWKNFGETYETFYFPDNFEITFPSGYQGFRKALEAKFPDDLASITAYFDAVFSVIPHSLLFFAGKVLPSWVAKAGRAALQFKPSKGVRDPWRTTTAEVLERLIPNPKLRAVVTGQWGYYGSSPSESSFAIHAMTAVHFMKGGFYPVGGSTNIARGMLKTVRDAGGETIVRASVESVLIENGRAVGVRLADGREIIAKRVISAAGAKNTVNGLLPESQRDKEWVRSISAIPSSPPFITLYIGFEGDIEAAGASKANQWFMNTWDMDDKEWNLLDPKSEAPILYMSFPSLKDPRHEPGPSKKHTAEVVTFVPWEAFEKWKHTRRGYREADYAEFKKDIETRIFEQLKRHKPELLKLMTYHELSTPLSAQHFIRAHHGAIYGLEATPRRFTAPELRPATPLEGFYMAGCDVGTLGVTGAMVGGVLAAATIKPKVLAKLL